jgi:hypothetical protein
MGHVGGHADGASSCWGHVDRASLSSSWVPSMWRERRGSGEGVADMMFPAGVHDREDMDVRTRGERRGSGWQWLAPHQPRPWHGICVSIPLREGVTLLISSWHGELEAGDGFSNKGR